MRHLLKWITIFYVKYLQKRYKTISLKNRYNQTNQVINTLILLQAKLYYFKSQFKPWGYFHPDCSWTEKDEKFFNKLFPEKDFEELPIVIWHNPEAVTYYHNKIFYMSKEKPPIYEIEIKKQLKKWKNWN
ncbi:MAG: hypothetical protein KatS3mg035_1000 [Bacteroidia bacterium]|nr:MAG: hypothetical protein KatS3mg035_1000 [Bacteroidia bacterium]